MCDLLLRHYNENDFTFSLFVVSEEEVSKAKESILEMIIVHMFAYNQADEAQGLMVVDKLKPRTGAPNPLTMGK